MIVRMQNRSGTFLREFGRWFRPGLGVKRWFLFVLTGITLLGLGFAVILIELYRTDSSNPILLTLLAYASLRFLPRLVRAVIFTGLGIGLVLYGIIRLNRSLLAPFLRPGSDVVDQIQVFRRRERGPRVVAIGGGNGLSTFLRGIKSHTSNLTAVVTVADDGGSSGRLRESLGILPPGDIRNCLAALSNDEDLLTLLFQYRFSGAHELDGHSFGNLFITALADITGSFESAVVESGRVLSVNGRVLPSTLHDVKLVADMEVPHSINQVRIEGESRIPEMTGRVRRIWLEPDNAPAFPPVIQEILNADLIVVGPGSLYTSLLPNLLVRDLHSAMHVSRAAKIFVCNIATQSGETDSFSCFDHVRALEGHVGEDLFDVIVCNDNYSGQIGPTSQWVRVDERSLADPRTYPADLVDPGHPWRHDAAKLAQVIMDIYMERTGPL
ncbi:MAG: uridine diphosphate-N-acetylglucosamine-binding protein YvcK, partial [Chloroflexi bacterium]|nr:uridine diphosphate-N-acetylglucosamine-binding protein YvcK [Chloroflexota bacterium]